MRLQKKGGTWVGEVRGEGVIKGLISKAEFPALCMSRAWAVRCGVYHG